MRKYTIHSNVSFHVIVDVACSLKYTQTGNEVTTASIIASESVRNTSEI